MVACHEAGPGAAVQTDRNTAQALIFSISPSAFLSASSHHPPSLVVGRAHLEQIDIMVGVLTVSTSASPFPYAAVAIATLTLKAEVNFDESVQTTTLSLNGSQFVGEEEVVRVLAKEGGLADDSAKVRSILKVCGVDLTSCSPIYRRSSFLRLRRSSRPAQFLLSWLVPWTHWTITWHTARSSLDTTSVLQILWSGVL